MAASPSLPGEPFFGATMRYRGRQLDDIPIYAQCSKVYAKEMSALRWCEQANHKYPHCRFAVRQLLADIGWIVIRVPGYPECYESRHSALAIHAEQNADSLPF